LLAGRREARDRRRVNREIPPLFVFLWPRLLWEEPERDPVGVSVAMLRQQQCMRV